MNDRHVDTNIRRDIAVDAILISNGPMEVFKNIRNIIEISHKVDIPDF